MALLIFAVTLFVSAFILFLVQPIIGKLILPRLGGTPQVWNTCMVFFQLVLLAGYAYTHTVSTRWPLRRQLLVHVILLLVPFIVLLPPIGPFDVSGFTPPPGANPIPYTLGYLFMYVGLPFFVVSTSAPLLQKWFVFTGDKAAKDPYFLYSASNLGSLLALLAYPMFLEGALSLNMQKYVWVGGYGVLLVAVAFCAYLLWKAPAAVKWAASQAAEGHDAPPFAASAEAATAVPPKPQPAPARPQPAPAAKSTAVKKGKPQPKHAPRDIEVGGVSLPKTDEITGWRRLRWIALGAIPSSLMLGVTTHITTDLSPIPLFWLIPLTLYLLSFILVFSRWPVPWTGQPHQAMLYLQPVVLVVMLFVEFWKPSYWAPIIFDTLAFFVTAMVCLGELARDRPGTRHLTEFYLLMSVGGAVGGMFNGLIAPVLFPGLWEYNIAIFLAGMVRPTMKDSGWADDAVAGFIGDQGAAGPKGKGKALGVHAESNTNFHYTMDVVLAIGVLVLVCILMFMIFKGDLTQARFAQDTAAAANARAQAAVKILGVPLLVACFFMFRPLRFGLAIGAILLAIVLEEGGAYLFKTRSYFGIITVQRQHGAGGGQFPYNSLIHGHINHGMNFVQPEGKDRGNKDKDFSRLATTYYHRWGPVGVVMEKFNWGSWYTGLDNTFHADARIVASLTGLQATRNVPLLGGLGNGLPLDQFVQLWSEPPLATIGLGTGTMASYARPFQHMHFYEIDNQIRRLSLPLKGSPFFTYLEQAKARRAEVQVLMGDARLRMAQPYAPYSEQEELAGRRSDGSALGGGPDGFYHMMVVDAFSSDAIPCHLLTKQAFEMYFKKLSETGILCVHTSNRYVNLPKVVAAVANDLGLHYRTGHDLAPERDQPNATMVERGHYTSEWVMVARKAEYLSHLQEPPGYRSKVPPGTEEYWRLFPLPDNRYVWTDDYYNLLAVMKPLFR